MENGKGEKWGKVQGIRSINDGYKTDRGEVKDRMGNEEAKELICMTHGHELRGVGCSLSLIHISEPTRQRCVSRMPSSA